MENFDLIVIGTGPAGEKAAVKAAYFGHKVAIIEKATVFGGAEIVTGTLPSKTLKETALYFSGKLDENVFSVTKDLSHAISIDDFMYRKNFVTSEEATEIYNNLMRHGVKIFRGAASFQDAHTLKIKGEQETLISGTFILIATGSYPYHPKTIPFDGKKIHDSDTILQLQRFPKSLCIVGAGVIGCEYATIFAAIGTKVFLVNDKERILPFIDNEISQTLVKEMEASGIKILFNNSVTSLTPTTADDQPLMVTLKNGDPLSVDMFLFAAGRNGNVKSLECEKVGIKVNERELITVDATYKTSVPHIYAAGDCIGFPALASTSMDQGRVAVAHMFKREDVTSLTKHFPYGIYTIPEVSMVGMTEEQAIKDKVPYLIGKARYADMPRGKIVGAKSGFLKMVVDKQTLKILGIHILGRISTEIIHYGVLLIEENKDLNFVINQVFNYPTLHDLYKYAAYDALSAYAGHKVKG